MSSQAAEPVAGTADHGALLGLTDDDHPQYLLLADRAGGQVIGPLVDTGLAIRDNAVPIGTDLFSVEDSGGSNFFAVRDDELDVGLEAQRLLRVVYSPLGGRGGIEFLPDDFTHMVAPSLAYALQWDSTVVANIPGGAPFGNDTAPAAVGFLGECRYDDSGNLFSSALLFNQATILTANGVNVGPAYTMVNQPVVRTGTLGGSRAFSQANALRSQLRVGPNLAGNATLTSHEPFFATTAVDATVGTASITTCNYFASKAPTLTAGGTIGTLNCFDIPNIPGAGITTLRGLNSAMSAGTFINHTGTAPAIFTAADFQFDADGIGVEFGVGQDVLENWNGSAWELDPLVGDDFRVEFRAGGHSLRSSDPTGELRVDYDSMVFGSNSVIGNQTVRWDAPGVTIMTAGEFVQYLLTQTGTVDANGNAMSRLDAWRVGSMSIALSGGSVTEVTTLAAEAMTTSGLGGGETQALRVTGRSRLRGTVQLEPIAPANMTGTINAWAGLLTGSQNNGMRGWARITCDAATTLNGIDATAVQDGDTYDVTNVGANSLTVANQAGAAAAADRIILGGHSGTLAVDETMTFRYDATARWRVLFSN